MKCLYQKYLALLLLTVVLFTSNRKAQAQEGQKAETLFSKLALENARQRLNALKSVSTYSIKLNVSYFYLNAPILTIRTQASVSKNLQQHIMSSMIQEDVSSNELQKLHQESITKKQDQIRVTKKTIYVLFSIGLYYDHHEGAGKKYSVTACTMLGSPDIPQADIDKLNLYRSSFSLALNDSTLAANDAVLKALIAYIEEVLQKNYIVYSGKKYFTHDTLFVNQSANNIQLNVLDAGNKPFDNTTLWDNATTGADKSMALFNRGTASTDMSGTVVRAVSSKLSVAIRVVVIRILYKKSIYDDFGFDGNDPDICFKYPSHKTTPAAGQVWKMVPSTNEFTPVRVTVEPERAAPRITFACSNNAFKLQSSMLATKVIAPGINELQLNISSGEKNKETRITPSINGVALDYACMNAASYEKIVKEVTVVMIEEENDDIQVHPEDTKNLQPMTPVVLPGNNGFLDSYPRISGDDKMVFDTQRGFDIIVAGANGICETEAATTNSTFYPELTVDLAKFEEALNRFYNAYMVSWKVDMVLHKKAINYDLDKNGYLDIGHFFEGKFVASPEEALVYEARNKSYEHNVILVEEVQVRDVLARTTGDLKSTIVFAGNLRKWLTDVGKSQDRVPNSVYETSAHELGHMAFQLMDLASITKDYQNLMNWNVDLSINFLRKFQWDIMHGKLSPDAQRVLNN